MRNKILAIKQICYFILFQIVPLGVSSISIPIFFNLSLISSAFTKFFSALAIFLKSINSFIKSLFDSSLTEPIPSQLSGLLFKIPSIFPDDKSFIFNSFFSLSLVDFDNF